MSEIFDKAIVEKRNVLNELRANNLSLQELRFFSIYLSKINPYDKSTRNVRFPLDDFKRIMDFGKLNITQLKMSTDSLLGKKVHIPLESGGFEGVVLFSKCRVDKDNNGVWYVEICASIEALPLMFDFKDRYFKYELWNALKLRSATQVRMYEILKQYENLGKREIYIDELRELLGIDKTEYSGRTGWSDFKKRIIDSCQDALKENTDICYKYERGKTGKGGKWLSIIFYISKNTSYKDQLTIEDFLNDKKEKIGDVSLETNFERNIDKLYEDETDIIEVDYGSELANLLGSAALEDEFSPEQVRVIQDLVLNAVHSNNHLEMCDYLIKQIHKMNVYNPTKEKRFTYLCRMIETDIEKD